MDLDACVGRVGGVVTCVTAVLAELENPEAVQVPSVTPGPPLEQQRVEILAVEDAASRVDLRQYLLDKLANCARRVPNFHSLLQSSVDPYLLSELQKTL